MKNYFFTLMMLISINAHSQTAGNGQIENSYPIYNCTDYVMKINNWEICSVYNSSTFDAKIGLTPVKVNNDIIIGNLNVDDDSGNYKDYMSSSTIYFSNEGITDVIINERGLSLNNVQVGDPINAGRALFPRWKELSSTSIEVGYGNRGGRIIISYNRGVITSIEYFQPL